MRTDGAGARSDDVPWLVRVANCGLRAGRERGTTRDRRRRGKECIKTHARFVEIYARGCARF